MDMTTLVANLIGQRDAPFDALFAEANVQPPVFIWRPQPSALTRPLLVRFNELVQHRLNPDGTLNVDDLDLRDFAELERWIIRVDIDDADKLTFRHFGKGIAAYRGLDQTGQNVQGHAPHTSAFICAGYRAVRDARAPALTVHVSSLQGFSHQWRRLIFPIAAGPSTKEHPKPIIGLIAIAFPDNDLAPGLESLSDPIIVTDQDLLVFFANRHARELFSEGIHPPWRQNLFDFAQIQIDVGTPPKSLYETCAAKTFEVRHVSHTILSNMIVRVSGLKHNGRYYYLMDIRPE